MVDQEAQHVAIQITAMLKKSKPFFTEECCIYRVPYQIRKINHDAYAPRIVSIGPFHHGDERLANMEGQKQIWCKKFIERSKATLEELVSCVQNLEPKIRSSYSETIKLSKEEFVKVILVDCGFIFELFLRYRSYQERTQNDAIFTIPRMRNDILYDLLLLENQVPLFVLEELYNLAFPSNLRAGSSFLDRCFISFGDILDSFVVVTSRAEKTAHQHLTDLLRACYLHPFDKLPSRKEGALTHLPSATQLKEAGVKFRVMSEASKCPLDLEFSGHILKIPQIRVHSVTETFLRNLIAFEQCHYPSEPYITDYIKFLDFLINTDKDVEILVKKEIIINWEGDCNAVAKLFNGLMKNIALESFNSEYLRIANELNALCKHPVHRSMATLRRDYCNTPWKTAASVAAIVLLILTVVQTVCSILQAK